MRSGQESCFSEPLTEPVPLPAATAMPPEDGFADGTNLAFLLLAAPGRISISVFVAGFAPPASIAICVMDLEKARSLLRANPTCEEGRGGDVDQLDDNYKLSFSFTIVEENKARSFSFTIAEENKA